MRLYSFLEHSECVFLLGDARGWAEGQSGFQQTQKKETGKEKYIFFKASLNPLKSCTCMFTFFQGAAWCWRAPEWRNATVGSLKSNTKVATSTTNIHDLWFRELLVKKQARWRRKMNKQEQLWSWIHQATRSIWKPVLLWCVERSLFEGFLSDGLKWKCLERKKPSSLGTKTRSTDWTFLLWVCDFHCFQWLTRKRAPEVVTNTFKIPPVSGW